MLTQCLRLAVLVAALLTAVTTASAKPPCKPTVGESDAQVVRRCGKPDEVYATRSITGWRVEEWRYGAIYVGLIDGRVNYVLN
jgi:hypothetical protein